MSRFLAFRWPSPRFPPPPPHLSTAPSFSTGPALGTPRKAIRADPVRDAVPVNITTASPSARRPGQTSARAAGAAVRPPTGLAGTAARPPTGISGAVAVDVADPDLDADVRAVLVALALDAAPAGDPAAGVLVTDRLDVRVGDGRSRVVRVGSDQQPHGDDDEVLRLPSGTGDLVAALVAREQTRVGPLVVVQGAVGGCGASTLAAAMAVRAAPSIRTLLVEADPRGTGVDLLLGAEAEPGLRVEDVRAELGGPDPEALWGAVPMTPPGLGILSRSRTRLAEADPDSANDGAPGAAWAHRSAGGLVVCDSGAAGDGRGPGGPGVADLVVVVTRADLPGAVAAGRAVADAPDAVLVVRTGRADPLHAADVADAAGAARWYVLPEIGAVRRAVGAGDLGAALASRGAGRGRVRRLASVADALLEEVGLDER